MAVDAVAGGQGNVVDLMTGPIPANPFERMVVVLTETHYHGLRIKLFGKPAVEPIYDPVPLPDHHPVISAALQKREIRGFVNWMRFPVYEIEEQVEGFLVTIRDLRYVLPDATPGDMIGTAQVFVSRTD